MEYNQHTGYSFERFTRKTKILDVVIGGTNTGFDEDLTENFVVDKMCDVYLDNFTTFDAKANTTAPYMAFLIEFDNLNIQNSTNKPNIKDKLVIPNEATETDKTIVHKGKKYNFICTVLPTVMKRISGTITNLATPATVSFDADGRFIMELLFVNREPHSK